MASSLISTLTPHVPPVGRTTRFTDTHIDMSHGAGGLASRRLVEGLFAPIFGGPLLSPLTDAASLEIGGLRLAMTSDGFVVRPLEFPGGSIGDLAVNGTVNDLAVSGARPVAILTNFVIEAGLSRTTLERVLVALASAAQGADVPIAGGDTKVVEHGKADGIYITTTGLGVVDARLTLSPQSVRPGDVVLLSGPIGDHGITILLSRGDLDFDSTLRSDTRSVWPMVQSLINDAASAVRWMRDPTRGGVGTALNELARDANLGVVLFEERMPMRPAVRGACELLGLDPLHIANEGQFLAVVARESADAALAALQRVPGGQDAAIVGEIRESPAKTLLSVAPYGSARVVDMLVGDPLPRIC